MIELEATGRVRDWLQLGVLVLGILGGLVAAVKALFDLRENLRWKRADTAKAFLSEIHEHDFASNAVMMLDWHDSQHEYAITPDEKQDISYQQVLTALGKDKKDCTDLERFIRDCFDWFFYFIDRIEHYLTLKLIKFEDVAAVFKPYAKVIELNKDTYVEFMKAHYYESALKFWRRYWDARAK